MRVLITGGAGYIGSHIAKLFHVKYHADVLNVDIKWGIKRLRWLPDPYGRPFAMDARYQNDLLAVMTQYSPDVVIHLAAHSSPAESNRMIDKYYDNNVKSTLSVLTAMAQTETVRKLIFASTCLVYDNELNDGDCPRHTSDHLYPECVYSNSKLICESIIERFSEFHGINAAIFRIFNAAGADPDLKIGEFNTKEGRFFKAMFDTAAGMQPVLEIYGGEYPTSDGTIERDYIHVCDVAEAFWCGFKHLQLNSGVGLFNIGTSHRYSLLKLVDIATSVIGHKIPFKIVSGRQHDAPCIYSNAIDMAVLGVKPKYNIFDIIKTGWDWHKKITEITR